MSPVTDDFKVFPFICRFVADLIAGGHDCSGEIFLEISEVAGMSIILPIVKDNGICGKHCPVAVDPHIM